MKDWSPRPPTSVTRPILIASDLGAVRDEHPWHPARNAKAKATISNGTRSLFIGSSVTSTVSFLIVGHHQLGPAGSVPVITRVVADVVGRAVIVVVEAEVDTELRRPGLVDGHEPGGVEVALRPGSV